MIGGDGVENEVKAGPDLGLARVCPGGRSSREEQPLSSSGHRGRLARRSRGDRPESNRVSSGPAPGGRKSCPMCRPKDRPLCAAVCARRCGRPTVPSTGCGTKQRCSCARSARRTALPASSARSVDPDVGIMCQLVQASVSENQAWQSVKCQNEIKVLVLYGTLADASRFRGVLRWSFQSLGNVILTEFRSPAR